MEDHLHHSEDFFIRKLLNETTLDEIMSPKVISVAPHDSFHRVVDIFHEKGIRHLPVVNHEGRVVGLITQRDLYKLQSPRRREDGSDYYDASELDNFELSAVMRHEVCTMPGTDSVGEAIRKMVRSKYGCIPVVNGEGKLAGIVTQHDILRMAVEILDESGEGQA